MRDKALHTAFEAAFEKVSKTRQTFPPDVLLHFYALYKQATHGTSFGQSSSVNEHELVSAFKMNAILQVKHLSQEEAKQAYIEAANTYVK